MMRGSEKQSSRARSSRAERAERDASDAQLLQALADGSLEELGVLFDRHGASVRSCLARMGTPWSEIDDLVQSTFLEVARAAARFDPGRASARVWIVGIAIMMLRRQRRSVASALARAAQWVGVAERAPLTPSEAFECDETAKRLACALRRMSPKKREAFVLVSIEGFSGEEAARALGVPVKTIWTRLHHARRELLHVLDEPEGGDT